MALEERLDAHLEGLALAAREAGNVLEAAFHGHDADAAFAAAAALLMTREPASRERAVQALGVVSPPARGGIAEALCYAPPVPAILDVLRLRLGRSSTPDAVALEILSFHRSLDPDGLSFAATAAEPGTRRAVARAWGRIGGRAPWIERLAAAEEPEVRDHALAAAARRGLPWVLPRLRDICRDGVQVSAESIRLLARLGDRSDIDLLRACAGRPGLGEAAIGGLATLGYLECADALVGFVDDVGLARSAGCAFNRITGWSPPATHDGRDMQEVEDATFEDLRSVPDAGATRAAWRERRGDFDPSMRWRGGQPLVPERWRSAPDDGDLLTRREELSRLWMSEPALFPTLELDAPAVRQRAATA
jgi:hypothetical protein